MKSLFKLVILILGISLIASCAKDDEMPVGHSTSNVEGISLKSSSPNTIIIKPSNNTNDVRLFSINVTGNAPCVPLVAWTWGGTSGKMRQLMKFDLSSIKSVGQIKKVTLSLYSHADSKGVVGMNSNSGSNNSFYVQRVTAPWSRESVTYANQPSVTTINQATVPHTSSPILDIFNIDLTEMVKGMVSENKNYGFLLKLANEVNYTSRVFYSSWYSDASKHPYITIELEPTEKTLALQPSNNTNDVRLFSINVTGNSPCVPLVAWTWEGLSGKMRQLMKFDLSSIKSTSQIKKATLSLYSHADSKGVVGMNNNSGSNTSFYVQRVTAPWSRESVTYANQPSATTTNQAVIPHAFSLNINALNIDLTEMVKGMVSENKNYGFLLKLANEVNYTSRVFYSSWYSDASKHPILTIVYEE